MIELTGVRFAYASAPDLLKGCGLRAGAGEVLALAGPNGAGKSTLLRLAAGLVRPGSGEVRLDGRPIGDWRRVEVAARLAYSPQSPTLPDEWPVEAIVELGNYPHRASGASPHRAAGAAARPLSARLAWAREVLGLHALWGREARTLSGGEKQRVALARMLVQDAPNLVLDEPASHLDLAHQLALFRLLRGLAGEGRSVLLSTHDLNLSRLFGQRLLLLGGSGLPQPFPEDREEQRRALRETFGVAFHPLEVRGVTCWFPEVMEPESRRAGESEK